MKALFLTIAFIAIPGTLHAGWSQWYVQTVKGQRFAAMREDTDYRRTRKEWSINQKWWENNQFGGITQLIIGSITDESFVPYALSVEKKVGKKPIRADGRTRKGVLKITAFEKGRQTIEKKIKPNIGTTWGVFAALYTMKEWQKNKSKKNGDELKTAAFSFLAMLEEPEGNSYDPVAINVTPRDRHIKHMKKRCYEFRVDFLGEQMQWFVTEDGMLCKLLNPSKQIELVAVDSKTAKGFLGDVP